MKPKEKAKQLVSKFQFNTKVYHPKDGWVNSMTDMKQCALICVDEMLKSHYGSDKPSEYVFWEEVKQEIELL